MYTDLHTHTKVFSPDAEMSIEELMDTAVKKDLSMVAVTEHFEYKNPDPNDNIQTFDLGLYTKTFSSWKERCPSGLDLLMGIEFGYQTHTASEIDEIAGSAPFDIVLLSNHLFRGVDVFYSDVVYKLPVKERHAEYMAKMAEMVEKCNNFDVAAHYDYVNKRNPDSVTNMCYDDCPSEFDRFFEVLIAKEKALEINTSTSYRRNSMPDAKVIDRYLKMGGKLITVSSDSHTKDNLGRLIPEMTEFLKAVGVRELCYFKNRKVNTFSI